MEPRFGADFSPVRIHTGQNAISMNNQISAKAFTHQNDIYFNQGQYNPDSSSGKHLLAHELTHTIQQGAAVQRKPQISTNAQPKIQRGISDMLNDVARQIPGYTLFTVIIGHNPITGDSVERTPTNFVGGFLGLLPGGTALFDKLKETGAIEDMMTWLGNEIKQLGITWSYLKGLINDIWDDVSITYSWNTNYGIAKRYLAEPYNRVKRFVKNIANKVKELIFIGALKLVGAPVETVMGIINKGASVLTKIFSDPIGFIKNLFKGLKLGLDGFVLRIQKHVLNGLTGWLFGSMAEAGIQMPQKFDLKGVFQLLAQLLGLTYQQIRTQIVNKLGKKGETIVSTLETSFEFVQILLTGGPLALWDHIKQSLSDLKQTVVDGIKDYLIKTVVKEGIFWILGLINPAGALVKVVKTLVNVVMFFVERFQQIVDFAKSIFDAVGKIASGDLKQAAKAVENAIAKSLPVMIGFLANLIGLGGLAKSVVNIMKKIGDKVKNVINKVVAWIAKKGRKLFKKIKTKSKDLVGGLVKWKEVKKGFQTHDKKKHKIYVEKSKKKAKVMVASVPKELDDILKLRVLPLSSKDYNTAIAKYQELQDANDEFEALKSKYNLDHIFYSGKKGNTLQQRKGQGAMPKKLMSEISGISAKYHHHFNTLSDLLKKYGLEGIHPHAVTTQINVAYNSHGMPLNGLAKPLTALPGNTKGAKASAAVTAIQGQEYIGILRSIYGVHTQIYHRTHMIHDRLHGPATDANLVYATKNLNHSFINMEHDVIRRVYKPGEIMYFHVSQILYNAKHKWFARKFVAAWGYMKITSLGPPVTVDNDSKREKGQGSFEDDAPPEITAEQKPLRSLTGAKVAALGTALGIAPPTDFAKRFRALSTPRRVNGKNLARMPLLDSIKALYGSSMGISRGYQPHEAPDTTFLQQLETEAHNRNIEIVLK